MGIWTFILGVAVGAGVLVAALVLANVDHVQLRRAWLVWGAMAGGLALTGLQELVDARRQVLSAIGQSQGFFEGFPPPDLVLAASAPHPELRGLPGLMAYKMVNTADSMIGYRTERYEDFGWAAARLDDWMNHVPARISAGLIWVASLLPGFDRASVARAVREDASLHRSPNAGWPEAARQGRALMDPTCGSGTFLSEKPRSKKARASASRRIP